MPLPTSVADRRPSAAAAVPQLREQRVDRRREVVDRVEQRAVEVEARSRDREAESAAVGSSDPRSSGRASSARMRAIVAA